MARYVRRVVALVYAVALLAAIGALATHSRLAPTTFEFGRTRMLEGVLRRAPYPRLVTGDGVVWLVGAGKAGAEAALADLPDGPVRVKGTRAERRGHALLELDRRPLPLGSGTIGTKPVPSGSGTDGTVLAPRVAVSADQPVVLYGEIVDSKCFLGVMNPGERTVHRDCARVCLRGGIPPMLLVRDRAGDETLIVLVDDAGRAIGTAIAPLAGIPVEVRGRLRRTLEADAPVIATSLAQIRPVRR
jgi:hypothetical protein